MRFCGRRGLSSFRNGTTAVVSLCSVAVPNTGSYVAVTKSWRWIIRKYPGKLRRHEMLSLDKKSSR